MCKLDKSLNTWVKVISQSHEKCLARKPWTWVELRPIQTIWFDQPPVGGVQTGQLKRRGAFACSLSLPPCNSLALLNSARSNARKADLEAGPPDSLSTKPTIGGGLRPCQSRNGATKSTVAEESFPGDVTRQRSKPAEFPEQRRSWTRDARNKELNSRGKTNQRRACFKPIQASTNWISNPDWTG